MLAIENIFGLGQDPTPAVPAASVPITLPADASRSVVIPAIPDNTVVRCKFDSTIKSFRCAPVGVFEPPTVFLLAAAGVALIGIGYALGRTRFLPRFTERLVEEPIRRISR